MLRIITQTKRMNEKKKKRLVGACVVMTAFVMVVVMALEAIGCLFPSLEVEQVAEGGAGSKAHQRLLLGVLTEEEMKEYRRLPEEKRKVVHIWMNAGFKRMELTDAMLEKMAGLNLKADNQNLSDELKKHLGPLGWKQRQIRRIVAYLSEVSQPCVPICFREDADVRKEKFARKFEEGYEAMYALMESVAFQDATFVATKGNADSDTRCYLSIYQCWGRPVASATRENEGVSYANDMVRATTDLRDLDNDLGAESRMLIIGHGIGYLPFQLQKEFPQVHIDSVDIDQAVFKIADEWFCYHKMMADNLRIEQIVADGIQFFEELKTGKKEYDVIHLDVFESGRILPYFEDEQFFRCVDGLWKLWNDVVDRPRMLVINGDHEDGREISKTTVYRNALEVFDPDRVKVHSYTIFSVTSVDRKCVDDGSQTVDQEVYGHSSLIDE